MTVSDIVTVIATVASTQLVCDLAARRFVFSGEAYQGARGQLSRAQFNLKKDQERAKSNPAKHEKKLARTQEAHDEAAAAVAQKHASVAMYTSLVFLVLYRILSAEYYGKVIGVLPFTPWSLVRRISMRGIELAPASLKFQDGEGIVKDPNQACAFIFIYLLSTLSVKFYLNEIIGVKPPPGADGGMLTMLSAPKNKKLLKQFGVDPDELKME